MPVGPASQVAAHKKEYFLLPDIERAGFAFDFGFEANAAAASGGVTVKPVPEFTAPAGGLIDITALAGDTMRTLGTQSSAMQDQLRPSTIETEHRLGRTGQAVQQKAGGLTASAASHQLIPSASTKVLHDDQKPRRGKDDRLCQHLDDPELL